MNLPDCVGLWFQTYKVSWWSNPDFERGKDWTDFLVCSGEAALAKCVKLYKGSRDTWLVVKSREGKSKDAYSWQRVERLKMLSPLEQLGVEAIE
jgi:hypothetical protein